MTAELVSLALYLAAIAVIGAGLLWFANWSVGFWDARDARDADRIPLGNPRWRPDLAERDEMTDDELARHRFDRDVEQALRIVKDGER
jgi:hypothetical protein